MYSANTKQNYQYFINNKKTIYHTFLDILIDFDSSDFENNFIQYMNSIDFDNYFFDIYGFNGIDIDSDVQLVKFKYDEFKNNTNNVFSIFLELI
jgi:hypothetical protein